MNKTFKFKAEGHSITVDVVLTGNRNGKDYTENNASYKLSLTGDIHRSNDGGWITGQIYDSFRNIVVNPKDEGLKEDLLTLWKEHLNDLRPGTREQEAALVGVSGNYMERVDILKEKGLYEVQLDSSPYRYGAAWLYFKLSDNALRILKKLKLIARD